MRLIDADALIEQIKIDSKGNEGQYGDEWLFMDTIETAPTIEPKTKVIAQVTFDEDKLREIVHEAVERIKEEYDIVDNPDAVSVVRCKECHFYVSENHECAYVERWVDDDCFCNYGEREGE